MHKNLHPEALKTYKALAWKAHDQSWVYFVHMRSTADSPVKIGWATNPLTRLRELQTGNPYPLEIRQLIIGGLSEEARLHARWADAKLSGEWFEAAYRDAIFAMADEIAERQVLSDADAVSDVLWEAPTPVRVGPQIGDGQIGFDRRVAAVLGVELADLDNVSDAAIDRALAKITEAGG